MRQPLSTPLAAFVSLFFYPCRCSLQHRTLISKSLTGVNPYHLLLRSLPSILKLALDHAPASRVTAENGQCTEYPIAPAALSILMAVPYTRNVQKEPKNN